MDFSDEKVCTSCKKVKPMDEFRFQRTNPSKRYAWCGECQRQNIRPPKRNTLKDEYAEMRAKTQQMRSLSKEQTDKVRQWMADGLTPQTIAAKLGVPDVVAKRAVKSLPASLTAAQ